MFASLLIAGHCRIGNVEVISILLLFIVALISSFRFCHCYFLFFKLHFQLTCCDDWSTSLVFFFTSFNSSFEVTPNQMIWIGIGLRHACALSFWNNQLLVVRHKLVHFWHTLLCNLFSFSGTSQPFYLLEQIPLCFTDVSTTYFKTTIFL